MIILMVCTFCLSTTNCKSQNSEKDMKKEITEVIETFIIAGEKRDIPAFDTILHPDFRVIVNQYPTPEKTSIIPGAGYIALMTQEKIGGKKYDTEFLNINVAKHSATAIVLLKNKESSMQVTFLLIKNNEDQWQIISDLAIQNPGS